MAPPLQRSRHTEACGDLKSSPITGAADSVTVVICSNSERRWQSLLRALQSLRDQSRLPEQCIVVIDHNKELLRRAQISLPDDVEVMASEERQGLPGARNTGLNAARGAVVAFLDDDAEAAPGWLEELLKPYTAPSVVGVGGRTVAVWPGRRPVWMPAEFEWVVGCSSNACLPKTIAPVRSLLGTAVSFRRSVLDQLGPFDTKMDRSHVPTMDCEETEFAIRVRRSLSGAELRYAPNAVVHHYVEPESARIRYFFRRCYSEGLHQAVVASGNGDYRVAFHPVDPLDSFPGHPRRV